MNIPPNNLEYDAYVRVALCYPSALPSNIALPAGERALVVVYAITDVRVSGPWPVHFQILTDFGDAAPQDPSFRVYRLDPRGAAYVPLAGASVGPTSAQFGLQPGYTVITVPEASPRAVGLCDSALTADLVFPSAVLAGVDNAFGLRSDGTGLQRITNALSPGYTDRVYVSRAGTQIAIVRAPLGGAAPEPIRIYVTVPSNPQVHLRQVATAQVGGTIGDVAFEPIASSLLVAGRFAGTSGAETGLYRVRLHASDAPELLHSDPGPTPPISVSPSPDGTRAALTTSRYFRDYVREGNYDVVLVPTDGADPGAEPLRLTAQLHEPPPPDDGAGADQAPGEPLARVNSVSYAPDGTVVYFGAESGDMRRVMWAAADGSGVGELEALRGGRWPAVSPDGASVICERGGALVRYDFGSGQVSYVGPPANGYGAALVSANATKISWRGR